MAAYNSPQYPHWQGAFEIDHVQAATTHLRSIFPEANLAPSSVEVTLIEALSSLIGPLALSYAHAPAAVVEHLMSLYGVYREESVKATGKARFIASSGVSRVDLKAGTRLRYIPEGSGSSLDFVTTEDLLIYPNDSIEGTVFIQAAEGGTHYNDLPVGLPLDSLDYILGIDSVSLAPHTLDADVGTAGGQDRESNKVFSKRAQAVLARQRSALVYVDQYEAAAISRPGVGRAFAISNYDAATSTARTGHVTVAVTNTAGLSLLPEEMDAIQGNLQADALSSLVVHVRPPWYTTVDLTVTVEATPDAVHDDVKAAVTALLRTRLDPMEWNWWNTITSYDVTSWIDEVPGVARVTYAPSNITLTGLAPLPLPGQITVNVTQATR